MVWKKNLLLKTFLLSLLLHLCGISIFSIVLPVTIKEIHPVEVALLPVNTSPEKAATEITEVKNISPAIPMTSPKREKIVIEPRKEILKFAPKEITGISQIITPSEILSTIPEIPEIKIPELTSFAGVVTSSEKKFSFSDVEIEGPAGDRLLIYKEPMEYPEWAIEKALEGNIRIKFWVAPDGKIVLTNIVTSSGYPELDLYTEQRLRKWMFEPVKTDKQAWGLITFRFQLK